MNPVKRRKNGRAHAGDRETVTDGLPMTNASTNGLPPAFLHRAPRLDLLVQALGDVVEKPVASPFTPETIVVPARGLEPWLAMELARRFGVWANPSFPSPSALVNELAAKVLGTRADSPYETGGNLAYAVAALLPEKLGDAAFAPIAAYLADDNDGSKRMALAHRMAQTFGAYLVHRPEWIRSAERGEETTDWQGPLWASVVARLGGDHVVHRTDALLERLVAADADARANLPERLCVFGLRGITATQLDVLAAVAATGSCELHFFENARVADAPERSRFVGNGDSFELLQDEAGRPYAPSRRWLTKLEGQARDALEQRFDLQLDAVYGGISQALLSIHACHGPMRECEVLRDQLLAVLAEDPQLEPHDICVLCPDLASYAPLIHAVFDLPHEDPRRLPYRVDGDASAEASLPVASAFLSLLDLLPTRLTASQVMDVLALEPIRARFGLLASDLDRIETWVTESGIRWGEDDRHREEEGQPALRDNTWRFGLDRLLLGYAMSPTERALFGGSLPFDDVEGASGRALGGFAAFGEALFAARNAVRGRKTTAEWETTLTEMLAALMESTFETEIQHRIVREALAEEAAAAAESGFDETLPLATLAAHLATRLARRGRSGGYTCGGVRFVPLTAGRIVPSPVVALLGMNLGTFPRVTRPLGFDRMAKDPRPGDPSPRDEDRQLFGEAVAAAEKLVLITYDGHSVRNNAERPPSVVVSELVDSIHRSIVKNVVVHHPLHPFSPRYFGTDGDPRLFSYAAGLCAGAQASRGVRQEAPTAFTRPLPAEDAAKMREIALDDLAKFFGNAVEPLCRTRLGLALRKDAEPLEDREPLDFDALERWKLGTRLLERALKGERFEGMPDDVRAAGSLPLGVAAAPSWEEVRTNVSRLADALKPHLAGCRPTPATIDLELRGHRLHGALHHVGPQGHVFYRYGKLRGEHKVATWVRHLAYLATSTGDAPVTNVFGRDPKGQVDHFRFAKVAHPERYLSDLLELYALGMRVPLAAFADPAFAYLESGAEGALAAAAESFRGQWGLHSKQEDGNAYVKYVWGEHTELDVPVTFAEAPVPTFEELVKRVYQPAFDHMEPV
jgi:exodeoxyribonuclease V gamma subunit